MDAIAEHSSSTTSHIASPGDAGDTVMRVLHVVRCRQHTVMWTLALCLMVGAAYYAVAPRYYRSKAQLQVIDQSGEDLASISEQSGSDGLMATQREVVRSPEVIRRAIDLLAPQHRVDFVDQPPRKWIEQVTSRLQASNVRKTNIIQLSYDSLEPESAAAVVRAVLDAYLSFVAESHRGAAADFLDMLTVQRDRFEDQLAQKQYALQVAREKIGHLALPDRENVVDPIVGRAIHLNEALLEAQRRRLDLQASRTTVREAIHTGQDLSQHVSLVQETVGEQAMLSALGLGQNDLEVLAYQQTRLLDLRSDLQRMTPFYGAAHPQIVTHEKLIADTEAFIASYQSNALNRPSGVAPEELGPMLVNMLDQSLAQAVEQERQLAASFEHARVEAAKQSGDLVKVDMLQREVDRIERTYELLDEKMQTVDLQQVHAPIQTTIVQEPLPNEQPASPKLPVVLVGSIVSGLALGIGIVYVQDLLDDRFGSPEEMARQLGCRVLSVVRELPLTGEVGVSAIQMFKNPRATESEAFRTLRTAIAMGADVSDRLVISSSEPGDGKTTVSSNLAVSYAQMGKRTLLIDCDLRKPGLTNLMDLKRHRGVSDILMAMEDVGSVAESCLYKTPLDTLDVIPAGPRRPDPAELLLGPNLAELLAWADTRYDQVLIDCPPILAVSDALIAAGLVDGVVLVVTPEKNHRRLVARACETFSGSGTPLLGLVANRISQQAGAGYGYGYGYGYGHEDDPSDSIEPTLPLAA